MPDAFQPSFSAGELSPEAKARVDVAKYRSGLDTCLNCIVHAAGGVSNRPGTIFTGYTIDDSNKSRLIPFKFNTDQTYQIEVGNQTLRFIRNGGFILEGSTIFNVVGVTLANPVVVDTDGHTLSNGDHIFLDGIVGTVELNARRYIAQGVSRKTITGITQANPAVVTSTAHGLSNSDTVYIVDVVGMTEVNQRLFTLANVAANTFELSGEDSSSHTAYTSGGTATLTTITLQDRDGANINATGYTAWVSGGTLGRLYEVTSPYVSSKVPDMKFAQSADVVSLVHQDYEPRELSRTNHDNWTLGTISFTPKISKPTAVTALLGKETANTAEDDYTTIDAITNANPGVVTAKTAGPTYNDDDQVYINHATGMTEINGGPYGIAAISGLNFSLADWDGNLIDTTSFGTYDGAADLGRYGKIQHKYRVTAIHKNTGEESLPSDEDDTAWTVSYAALSTTSRCKITWTAPTDAPVKEYNIYKEKNTVYGFIGVSKTTEFYDDNIAPELADTPPLTPSRNPFSKTISSQITPAIPGITQADPGVVRAVANGYVNGARVIIDGVVGMVEVNGMTYYAGSVTADTFELLDVDGDNVDTSGFTAYTSGGTASDYPGVVAHFEQRRVFGQQFNTPDTLHFTQTGHLNSFNESSPAKAGDGISFTLASTQVNEVRHLVSRGDLVIFTGGSFWTSTSGDSSYELANIRNREIEATQSSNLKPILTKNSIVFVQDGFNQVFDVTFSEEVNSLRSSEKTILSRHLIESRTIVDLAYQERPDSIIWFVLDDGSLIAMTYLIEYDVWGWHRHTTDGEFESVSTTPEGSEDAVYFVVKRTINNATRRMVERLHSRNFTDIRDGFFVDCGITHDNPVNITNVTKAKHPVVSASTHGLSENTLVDISDVDGMTEVNDTRYRAADVTAGTFRLVGSVLETAQSITAITAATPPVVTVTAHGYSDGDVIFVSGVGGMTEVNDLYFLVDDKTTNTFELQDMAGVDIVGAGYTAYTSGGGAEKTTSVDASAYTAYTEAGKLRESITVIRGLNHLEGESVAILSDGSVEPSKTVSGGAITLDQPGSRVHVGLPYTADIKTLSINDAEGQLTGRKLSVSKLHLNLIDTPYFQAGPNASNLTEYKPTEDSSTSPSPLITDKVEYTIKPGWNNNGQVLIRQSDPIPITVASIDLDFEVSDF